MKNITGNQTSRIVNCNQIKILTAHPCRDPINFLLNSIGFCTSTLLRNHKEGKKKQSIRYCKYIASSLHKIFRCAVPYVYRNILKMIDFIYRYFLSPQALREKRRLDQEYQIASAVKSSSNVNTCSEVDKNGMQSLIDNIMKDDFKTPSITGIEKGEGEGDCNLLLDVDGTVTSVPLEQFGIQLAKAFEQKLTSHTMCFVADASSGLGTKIIGNIAASCGAGMVSKTRSTCMHSISTVHKYHKYRIILV